MWVLRKEDNNIQEIPEWNKNLVKFRIFIFFQNGVTINKLTILI